jgi:exosortase
VAESIEERGAQPQGWTPGRVGPILAAVGALALIAVAYGRTASTLWRMWSHNDAYSHGFLIAPVSIFLAWSMRKQLRETPAAPTWAGLPVVAAAVLLHVAGVRGDVTMFQAYSLIFLLAGLTWTWFGGAMLRKAAFPIAFLVFAAPTFPVIVNGVSFRLKSIAAFGSVFLAQAMGVSVNRQSMDLYFPTGMMTIEGACSGLHSLIALMALGALFAYLGTGAAWRRWLLFLCSVPVALAGNIVRITSLCVYAGLTDTTRATGLFHDIGGFVLFGFALAAMFILKRLLRC